MEPQWKGLFEWSMAYQDGTKPTSYDHENWTPERRKWLEEALQQYMKDFGERMKEIKEVLDDSTSTPATLQEKEAILEELMDITASIDFARDLHKIGGLPTLLGLLSSPHPSLRWRAAEVVSTCVQNNPPVQEWFMQGGVLPPLMHLLNDTDPLCSSKALLAISSLIRNFPPALLAFREVGGLALLVGFIGSQDTRQQRKAISTLQYILTQVPQDSAAICQLSPLSALESTLSHEDGSSREAALNLMLELSKQPSCSRYFQQATSLPEALKKLQHQHQQLSADDRDAQAEELDLCQRLQTQLADISTSCTTNGAAGGSQQGDNGGGVAAGGLLGGHSDSSTSDGGVLGNIQQQIQGGGGGGGGSRDVQAAGQQLLHDQSLGLIAVPGSTLQQ